MIEKYNKRAEKVNSLVCVGLDTDFSKIPPSFKEKKFSQFEFNKWILDETMEFASAVKCNIAFYEARGERGLKELKMTMEYILQNFPDAFTICDAKRADIGNTNNGYVEEFFDYFKFDAVTLHPYLGKEALKPFLDRADKGCIILCRTSNPGASELQDLLSDGKPLWQILAEKVSSEWNFNQNCMLVVGATYPEEMKTIRSIVGDMTFLVPGVGAQGGSVEDAVKAGMNSQKLGLIINSSRGIIFAKEPKSEAQKLRDEINKYRI
jgi:orotidine-5'-phosphate decarboxylase